MLVFQKGGSMKYPGYEVAVVDGKVIIAHATFDETDLDPGTNWTETWQSQDQSSNTFGYVNLETALATVARLISGAGSPKNSRLTV